MNAGPILMHARSIQNLLAGRKAQTRRLIKPQPYSYSSLFAWQNKNGGRAIVGIRPIDLVDYAPCPYGKPGDLLWVRETWRTTGDDGRADYLKPSKLQPHPVWYEADGQAPHDALVGKLRPNIFMPRWASRLTLHLTDVRVERVQDISGADALAEGVRVNDSPIKDDVARMAFEALWNDTNGPGAWERNDWVWVLAFEVLRENVDRALERAKAAA